MNEYLMVAGFLFVYLVIGYMVMIVIKFVSEENLDEMDMLLSTCFFPIVLVFLAFYGFFLAGKVHGDKAGCIAGDDHRNS